ncbi:unnamed protein product [Ascophyllum nodosum]
MAPMKASITSLVVLSFLGQLVHGFLVPLPVGSSRAAAARRATVEPRSLSSRFEACPQRTHNTWRRQVSMSTSQRGNGQSFGKDGKGLADKVPRSRLSNISRRVRKMIRKAIMGYLPEEEISYKESTARAAAAAAASRSSTQVVDERLIGDSIKAQEAAAGLVEGRRESDEEDILGDDFVHLDIGDKSPMEAEDMITSLRKRLEKGLPADTEAETREKQRISRQQQQQQQKRERSSRPPSFDGDTAVAELPSLNSRAQPPLQHQQGGAGSTTPPKLASREDVERLERLFGSAGGEPLR